MGVRVPLLALVEYPESSLVVREAHNDSAHDVDDISLVIGVRGLLAALLQ